MPAPVLCSIVAAKQAGMCKPGYPGALFVEGEESDCREYTRRVRQDCGNWKALQVRGEERIAVQAGGTVDGTRAMPFEWGFRELQESEMGVMAQALESVGLGERFMTLILKIDGKKVTTKHAKKTTAGPGAAVR